MTKLFLLLIGAASVATTVSQEPEERWLWGNSYLKVKTSNGFVAGYLGKSCRTQKQFAGFRGIPYAQPPLGELRFRDPVPREDWDGIWNATFQRHSCVQGSIHEDEEIVEINGISEDCLYLNVYTPNLNYLKFGLGSPKAVMVFIHPGAFTTGSSSESMFSPDFFIDQDVVVVSFNYRLGALGFLSLQNEAVPGNAGLKDQNLALKWVKKNIKNFGGDPAKITIFGESAGSASVNFHMLSKASEGLFRSAIMQSGTAITPWAYSPADLSLRKSKNLAKKVGCHKKDMNDLLKCMQNVPAELITKYQQKALTLDELLSLRIIAFLPTTEPNLPGAFFTSHPFDLMYSGNFTKVPVIIGSTLDEGLMMYPTLTKLDPKGYLLTLIGMDLSRFAPYNFHLIPFTKPAIKVHQQISKFYFNSQMVTRAVMGRTLELVTDVMFTLPIQLTSSMMANSSVPVFNYLFSFDGKYNLGKLTYHIALPGVCHGDDLGYLFYSSDIQTQCGRNVSASAPEEVLIDRMTKMWANFAKTGNPTPKLDNHLTEKWNPFTSTDRAYMNINHTLIPSDSLKLANMVFWENLIMGLIKENKERINEEEAIDDMGISKLMAPLLSLARK